MNITSSTGGLWGMLPPMKLYPLTSPPNHPGIYAITNRVTGQIYIGKSVNLRRRFSEWKSVFATGLGATNMDILEIVLSSGADNWDFSVLFALPGASPEHLDDMETKAIARAIATRGTLVLNKTVRTNPCDGQRREGCTRKSYVRAEDGQEMTYPQAAAAIGVTTQTIKKRLQKYRSGGVLEVGIEELRARSREFTRV